MKKSILLITLIILVAALLGGAIYYFLYFKDRNVSQNTVSLEKDSDFPPPTGQSDTNQKLIYFNRSDTINEIRSYNLANKENLLLYSDKDQDNKINMLGGYAYLTNEVLVYDGSDATGKLALINLNDGKLNIINDLFAKPYVLAVSPDAKTIAYATTDDKSNSVIYQMAINGTNIRQIQNVQQRVVNLSFNLNADQLAYTKTSADNKSKIAVIDLNKIESKDIYLSSNQILSMTWQGLNQIVFSEGTNGQIKAGKAFILNPDGSNLKKIFGSNKNYPYSVMLSSDMINSGFILNEYKDKFENLLSGDIDTVKVGENNINKIGQANLILGWH